MALATLSIDLVAKLANFERDMGRAARVAEQNSARISRAFSSIQAGVAGLLGGATVGTLVSLVRAQVDAIDGFNDLKDATGASIENISALDSLARRTGVTFDTVGSSLIKFNAALKEGDKAGVFKALGLDVEKLKQLDPAEALRQTAVALAGFADDGEKARAVQELFGKSLREVAPLLKDLGEEGVLVAKVTAEQAEQAERFNKELFRLKAEATDVARSLSADLVSGLLKAIDHFKLAAKEGDSFLATLLKIQSLIPSLPAAQIPGQILSLYDKSQGSHKDRLATLDQALQDPTLSPSERAAMQKRRDQVQARLNETYAEGLTGDEAADAQSRRFGRRSLSLPPAQGKAGKPPKATKTRVTADPIGDVSDALSRRLDSIERGRKQIEALNDELDRLSGRDGDDRKRELTAALEARLNAGEVFSPEELDRIVRGIGGVSEALKDAKESTINFADVFESSFERALVKGEKAKDVLKGLFQDLATLYLRENVTKPLASAFSNYMTSAFSGGFAFADGGVMTSRGPLPLRTYSKGGVASSPQLAMFGEGSTPEAFVPLPDGRRIPVAMKGGGGGQIVQNFNMTVGDVASMSRVRDEIRAAQGQAAAQMRRAATYGRAS